MKFVPSCLWRSPEGFQDDMAISRVCSGIASSLRFSMTESSLLWAGRMSVEIARATSNELVVGATGFEPVASCAPRKCAKPDCATPRSKYLELLLTLSP